ncbi:hypothetical protein SNE40_018927 [Patella caerulea]|uniref:Delphilin n=1 Tax=Patella caerulea TaxID=87958 RepID=A0AAN8P4V0_PATCE
MPFRNPQTWPKSCGFEIYGYGPSYVIAVENNSVAKKAGLIPGDQILEVQGQDVSNLPSEKIKALVKRTQVAYPTLEVVACLQEINILPNHIIGYGFTCKNGRPLVVSTVEFGGPAYMAGLRKGDVILAVNGMSAANIQDIENVLTYKQGKLILLTIPVGRTSNMVQEDKNMNKFQFRLQDHRAKDLHEKMNSVLGDDYEKKMAVVGILKQYAEDRDVTLLAHALHTVLKTPQQRRILRQIRPFVPPSYRNHYDELMKGRSHSPATSEKASSIKSGPAAHKTGFRKTIQVIRDAGSFGLVIKGSNPAYIESVDRDGPSEKAGLQANDYIMKLNGIDVRKHGHGPLCQLLQESGSAPTIEILRCEEGLLNYNVSAPSASMYSISTESSASSHASIDWLTSQDHLDKEGRTFQERADFLLTNREKIYIKRALQNYEISKNIVDLHSEVATMLDSPSKKTLWMFIIARLPPEHQQYCLHRISLTQDILLECVHVQKYQESSPLLGHSSYSDDNSMQETTSFRQQLEFLLTSNERLQLKQILQHYEENKDVHTMLEETEIILDTPSKRSLWKYILPLIQTDHQMIVRQRLLYLQKYSRDSKVIKEKVELTSGSSSEDEKESSTASESSPRERLKVRSHSRSDLRSADKALVKELEETRKAIQEAKDAIIGRGQQLHEEFVEPVEESDNKRYVTIIPVGYPGLDGRPFYSKEMNSPEFNRIRKMSPNPTSVAAGRKKMDISSSESDTDFESRKSPLVRPGHFESKKVMVRSGDSFNESALTALEELDAVMAAETSDYDSENRLGSSITINGSNNHPSHSYSPRPSVRSAPLAPPAPPPPPPAPPAPKPFTAGSNQTVQMNVKRINWEKLNSNNVNNTVWQQLDDSELNDIVKYLELDQQFSTKTVKTGIGEKKPEIYILSPKKSYNISILLAHMKMSISEMKQAMFLMDEEILTPELLKQLLAYSPNKQEIEQYDKFKGDFEGLSKADQFAYEMSQIPNYEQRLKAMLFKANFEEKITEMKEHLRCIKSASQELHLSKKLAKILELILAMGNHMNKGNQRVGDATGFRITFLSQIDITKTSNNKSTFLHVLAEAVYNKFPDVLTIGDDLVHVPEATKVSNTSLNQELQELRKVLQDISDTLEKFNGHKHVIGTIDRFQEVMGHFIAEASDELQELFRLQAATMEEFSNMVQYFGEDPKKIDTSDLFGIFTDFITKFEKAHRHNMMYKRH